MNIQAAVSNLQKKCMYLPGNNVSFYVYFWGANPNHQDNPLHKHSFFEICYVLDGKGLYYEDGQNYPLEKGVFFCSRPRKLHQVHQGKNLSLIWIGFEVITSSSTEKGNRLFEHLAETNHIFVSNAENSPAAVLLMALLKHASVPCSSELLSSLNHSLLLSFQALFCGTSEKAEKEEINGETRGEFLMKQAQLFIRDNLTSTLSIDDVAHYLHVSPRHLSRLFTQISGISYTAFIRQERISACAEKLRTTSLDIKTISEQYCFSSVHYFTRVFQEETGSTPGMYRKQAQL